MNHDNTYLLRERWKVAIAGVIMQIMLGTVYGWSIFKNPLMMKHGWTGPEVGFTFTLVIFFLGFSAALGGRFVDRAGTRTIATCAAILFGVGTILAGIADTIGSKWLLWLGYGVVGGIGNGLGYITPVAVLVRWFPDKRGLITGFAVMGFGLGAALMGQLGALLVQQVGIAPSFYIFGSIFLVVLLLTAQKLYNPPVGWMPPSMQAKVSTQSQSSVSVVLSQARGMYQFYILWIMFFINITAGIALISNLSPMAQAQAGLSAVASGTLIFVVSLFNSVGRLFWAFLSDKLGRKPIFLFILVTQIPMFLLLPHLHGVVSFALVCCYIIFCYGGGFGTMPSFTADTFGPKNIGSVYGAMLFAWGVAGVVGPMVMEYIKQISNNFNTALTTSAVLLLIGFILLMFYRKPELKEGM